MNEPPNGPSATPAMPLLNVLARLMARIRREPPPIDQAEIRTALADLDGHEPSADAREVARHALENFPERSPPAGDATDQ